MNNTPSSFATSILNWHTTVDRNLPWKTSKNPYKIWLSEIILQQTRVAQGTPYYLKFIEAFPTITDLANADESTVMKLWQGLGYYSRARNLHHAAKTVRDQFDGQFPDTYEDILSLKGVGKYTAAAIASFAYDLAYPVVDGNVIRVISRYYGITEAIDTSSGLKKINALAVKLIQNSNPAEYNQAIMDFGALMCTPKSPNCVECPLNSDCIAFATDQVNSIPLKSKKIKKKTRYFHYLQITDQNDNLILKFRSEKDIWKSLNDFPMIENQSDQLLANKSIQTYLQNQFSFKYQSIKLPTKTYKHILSHQTIYALFYEIKVNEIDPVNPPFSTIHKNKLLDFAMPVLLTNYLKDRELPTLF